MTEHTPTPRETPKQRLRRERDAMIRALSTAGFNNRAIARQLDITRRTVIRVLHDEDDE